jgi:hypothetical protein
VLLACAGYTIVMLNYSYNVKHGFFGLKHRLDLFIGGGLVD